MKKCFIVIIFFSTFSMHSCYNKKSIVIELEQDTDSNGFYESGIYHESIKQRYSQTRIIDSMISKIYKFKFDNTDSIPIDLSSFGLNKVQFCKYFSMCGYDLYRNNDKIGWNQTPLLFQYLDGDKALILNAQTGCVDNSVNFWMHPPRQGKFMQNYTAPWPFVVYNKPTWNWTFTFNGTGWQNIILDSWTDTAKFTYKYDVVSKFKKQIKNKEYNCYKIHAHGISKLGKNFAEFEYCIDFGIYRYFCRNLDQSLFEFTFYDYIICPQEYSQ